jgi:hypothetical protein
VTRVKVAANGRSHFTLQASDRCTRLDDNFVEHKVVASSFWNFFLAVFPQCIHRFGRGDAIGALQSCMDFLKRRRGSVKLRSTAAHMRG